MAEIKKYLDTTALGTLVDQIKAEDAKALAAAKAYADGLAGNYDAAGTAETKANAALESAKAYTDELANGQVKLNKEAIETLNGTATTEGSVAKAIADAKTVIDGDIDAVEAIANKNKEDIAAINNAETGILAQAKSFATTEDAKVQANIDALAGKVGEVPTDKTVMGIIGEIQENAYDDTDLRADMAAELDKKADKTQVATDIADAVKVETDARVLAVQGVQDAVNTLSGTHATDKKTLEDAIALKADITALNAVSDVANAAVKQADYDVKVKALEDEDIRIAGLVATEQARAEGVEAGLDERLEKVEAFFVGAAEDEGEGENLKNALDTLVEIQTYIDNDGAAADQMVKDIAANKKAIEDHVATNHDFAAADTALKNELNAEIAKKADKTTVEGIDGRLTAEEGKVSTLQGEMAQAKLDIEAVEGAVATKVEQEAYNTKVGELVAADEAQVGRIAALEAKFNGEEGSVSDLIADAEQRAKDAAAADATTKANAARDAAKGYADTLNTAMNTRVEALEAIDHEHANKALLDTYTQTEADLADAVAKKHAHENATVLNGITAEKVAAWDAAEGNAKTYADGLNTTMTGKVDGVAARVKTLEETIVDKADVEDLTKAVERIAANESAIAANTSAINSFTPITSSEVEALFA